MADEKIPESLPSQGSNIEGSKYYVFNQTGNILMSSTDPKGEDIPESVRKVFNEVSVFFAAMTKSISQTINPLTNKAYSLYDLEAIESIVDGSGYFIHVNKSEIHTKSQTSGASFSKELISKVLGLAVSAGSVAGFATAMVASIGQAAKDKTDDSKYWDVVKNKDNSSSYVANIMFVCEYIMGMPLVTAIVMSTKAEQASQTFKAGPCYKSSSSEQTIDVKKDSYMFVTPEFIKEFASELNSSSNDTDYLTFINHLKALVRRQTEIIDIYDSNGENAIAVNDEKVRVNGNFILKGEYLDRVEQVKSSDDKVAIVKKVDAGSGQNLLKISIDFKNTKAAFDIQYKVAGEKDFRTAIVFNSIESATK